MSALNVPEAEIIFQPTLPPGERPVTAARSWTGVIFQPTLPPGERHSTLPSDKTNFEISTHAPARGATFYLFFRCIWQIISTHAPARGATSRDWIATARLSLFQPTPPRGERLALFRLLLSRTIFQPTPPRGERQFPPLCQKYWDRISTHAPARGATHHFGVNWCKNMISTHAPARGATLAGFHCLCRFQYFNPRPREGSDLVLAYSVFVITAYFNPRPREGSD